MLKDNIKIPLYIQTADKLREAIKSGLLAPGEKISHRKISEKYDVSKKTVAEAIDILHSEGLVIIKPRAGSFVNSNIWLPLIDKRTPDWKGIAQNSLSVPSSGSIYSIYKMISAEPHNHLGGTSISKDFNFHKIVKRGMELAIQRIDDSSDLYNLNILGLPSLRENLAKHMSNRGIICSGDDILVTTGPMAGLSIILLSILRYGMTLFIEETSILGAPSVARFTGAEIVRIACDEDGMIPDDLIDKMRKTRSSSVVCLSSVNQYPTGASLSKSRRDSIMSACVSKDIPIIECDLLRDFNQGEYPRPMKSFDTNDMVIYIGSFVCSFQNMKLGWIIAPPQIMKHITDTKTQFEINVNTVMQIIADEMLSSRAYCEYMSEYNSVFIDRLKFCRFLFEKYFTGLAKWGNNPLAFYQWLEFNNKVNTYKIIKKLKTTFVHSGFFFNPDDIHRIYINPMRDSIEHLEEGLKEIRSLIQNIESD